MLDFEPTIMLLQKNLIPTKEDEIFIVDLYKFNCLTRP